MSLGVKTSTGEKRIHSVHVKFDVPPGYISEHDVMDGIGENNAASNTTTEIFHFKSLSQNSPSYYVSKNSAGSYTIRMNLRASSWSESDHYSKVNGSTQFASGSAYFTSRYNDGTNSIYPNTTSAPNSVYNNSFELHIVRPNLFASYHPYLAKKYSLPRNDWFTVNETDAIPVKEVYNLQSSIKNRALIYKLSNGYGVYFYDYVPIFSKNGNTYRDTATGNCKRCLMPLLTVATNYSDIENIAAETVQSSTLSYSLAAIVGSTFDLVDNNGNTIYEANVDISDLVEVS